MSLSGYLHIGEFYSQSVTLIVNVMAALMSVLLDSITFFQIVC